MYHCKLVIVDDVWTSVGSTNIDERALRLNDEANINFYDREFARHQIAMFLSDLKRSTPYTITKWRQRPMSERFPDWLAGLLRTQI